MFCRYFVRENCAGLKFSLNSANLKVSRQDSLDSKQNLALSNLLLPPNTAQLFAQREVSND